MTVLEKIQGDPLAVSVAQALILANEAAVSQGFDPTNALITITRDSSPPDRLWRIHYGPWDCVHQRGGDFTVFVDAARGAVTKTLRGQ